MIIVSRCLERIGDHAVDIGEQTAYLVTGEFREFTDASHHDGTTPRELADRGGGLGDRSPRACLAQRAKAIVAITAARTKTSASPAGRRVRTSMPAPMRRGRDRQHPGDEDVARDAPADGREPPRRAGAEHRARDRVRRRDRGSRSARSPRGSTRSPSRPRSPAAGRASRSRPSVLMIRQPPA